VSCYSKRKHKKQRSEPCFTVERALNSIVLNRAEGSADNSDIEFARFLGISIRSAYEVVAGFDLALQYEMIIPSEVRR
jgi:four helix bundle protein